MPDDSDQGSPKPADRIAPGGDAAKSAHASEALPFARTLAEPSVPPLGIDTHGPTLPSPDPMNHPARRVSFEAARGAPSGPHRSGAPAAQKPAPAAAPARTAHSALLALAVLGVFALAGVLGFLALRTWSAHSASPHETHGGR